jgi:glycerol-3-phosphate O-acyltransferase
MGCDLLCIYSKRYIDYPQELREEKLLHNKKTMQLMSELLKEGGKIIYVAPSGGRDRKNKDGVIEVAPFDAGSIELLYLMARKAEVKTHFIPFTVETYHLFPPPATIQREIGEDRLIERGPIHIGFHSPFDMDHFPNAHLADKHIHRQKRAEALWEIVNRTYQSLSQR